jgi:hypothetical protein
MSDDYLINLLPSEYQPKPEFKGFPFFVLVLVILTVAFVYFDWRRENRMLKVEKRKLTKVTQEVSDARPLAMQALHVQARSRMLFSYGVTVWSMIHQNPPWVDVYNEIEESLPEGMWIDTLQMVGGGERKWPSYSMTGMVGGKETETVIKFYEHMLAPESKFEKVSISGYQFAKLKDREVTTFNLKFALKKTAFMGF